VCRVEGGQKYRWRPGLQSAEFPYMNVGGAFGAEEASKRTLEIYKWGIGFGTLNPFGAGYAFVLKKEEQYASLGRVFPVSSQIIFTGRDDSLGICMVIFPSKMYSIVRRNQE